MHPSGEYNASDAAVAQPFQAHPGYANNMMQAPNVYSVEPGMGNLGGYQNAQQQSNAAPSTDSEPNTVYGQLQGSATMAAISEVAKQQTHQQYQQQAQQQQQQQQTQQPPQQQQQHQAPQ